MIRQFSIFTVLIIAITMIFIAGCSGETKSSNKGKIAYVSTNVDSKYQGTFKELNLGVLFDFNLKVPNADRSWVNIWVEGYSNGKAVEPFPLRQLSYGLGPRQVEEGHMGFGIINPNSDEPQLFLYSSGASINPRGIENNFLIKSGISSWDYAIGSEPVGLEPGEEKVLAVYRQGEEALRTAYDYQDLDSINKMINEDKTVLLLKIKLEERIEL